MSYEQYAAVMSGKSGVQPYSAGEWERMSDQHKRLADEV